MIQTIDIQSQLQDCFSVVFPDAPRDELTHASISSLADWDSVATLTLVAVVEESFNIKIPVEDLVDLLSFELLHDYLSAKAA